MNKKTLILLFIVVALLFGAFVFNKYIKTSNKVKQTNEQTQKNEKDANKAHIDAMEQKISKLKTESEAIEAEITKLNEKIKTDTNALKDAKSKYDLANDDYVRYKNAYKDGAVTKFDIDNASKNFEAVSNTYKQCANALKYDENKLKTLISKKQLKDEQIQKHMTDIEERFK